ncbi:MAG TPA: STAS/SEC14 domain-containing protein [Mariprofundaceae bacterium]|nr:STAS/SEC14 domain-containing protein [Mariprofundaceae bacterium]
MIERISDLPEYVLGFRASGTITAEDYESVVIPAVEEMFSRQQRIRLLYHLGEEVEGFEAAAMWDDTKLGLKHFSGWERLAIVSDIAWLRVVIKAFGLTMPGQVRIFHNDEMPKAVRWINA